MIMIAMFDRFDVKKTEARSCGDSETFSFKNVPKIEIAKVLMPSHYLDRTGQLQRRIERGDLFMSDEKKLAAGFPRRKRDGILAAR